MKGLSIHAGVALLLGACASTPAAPGADWTNAPFSTHVDLPPAIAAAVLAGAVRDVLPLADPEPYAGGAPATRLAPDEFEVTYDCRADSWLPAARHRIQQCRIDHPVRVTATGRLTGYGLRADRSFRLRVSADRSAKSSVVSGEFPTRLADMLRAALTQRLAARHEACATTRALALANEHARAGELDYARHYRSCAGLATADPTLRAHVARAIQVPATSDMARRQARDHIAAEDFRAARALLHTARRAGADPARDYELLWQLHRRDEDRRFAFASALLLREYDRLGRGNAAAIAELQAQDLADLVERTLGLDPSYQAISRRQPQPQPPR